MQPVRAGPVRGPKRPAERQRVRRPAHPYWPRQGQPAAHTCRTQPDQLLASAADTQQGVKLCQD